jgi:predicted RND superfamily exporter protein
MVYYKTLKPEIKKGILNRQYSKEQLQQIHDALERDYRKSRKSTLIAAAVTIGFIVLCMVNTNSSEEFLITLAGALVVAGVFAFLIFVVLAMPKTQYVRCIKKAYPEYEESLGRNTFKSVH